MAEEADDSNAQLDAPTTSEIETLELFRRSPHPYLRHKDEIRKPSPDRSQFRSASRNPTYPINGTISGAGRRKHRETPSQSQSQSPSESGTEADDEGYSFVKALPPPPLRPHKGLREQEGSGQGAQSPLLTPTQIDDEGRKFSEEYFNSNKKGKRKGDVSYTDDEAQAARQKYRKRRRMELIRRATEVSLLTVIGILTVSGCGCWGEILGWHRGTAQCYEMVQRC